MRFVNPPLISALRSTINTETVPQMSWRKTRSISGFIVILIVMYAMTSRRLQEYILIELYVPIKTYFYVQIGLFWYLSTVTCNKYSDKLFFFLLYISYKTKYFQNITEMSLLFRFYWNKYLTTQNCPKFICVFGYEFSYEELPKCF